MEVAQPAPDGHRQMLQRDYITEKSYSLLVRGLSRQYGVLYERNGPTSLPYGLIVPITAGDRDRIGL